MSEKMDLCRSNRPRVTYRYVSQLRGGWVGRGAGGAVRGGDARAPSGPAPLPLLLPSPSPHVRCSMMLAMRLAGSTARSLLSMDCSYSSTNWASEVWGAGEGRGQGEGGAALCAGGIACGPSQAWPPLVCSAHPLPSQALPGQALPHAHLVHAVDARKLGDEEVEQRGAARHGPVLLARVVDLAPRLAGRLQPLVHLLRAGRSRGGRQARVGQRRWCERPVHSSQPCPPCAPPRPPARLRGLLGGGQDVDQLRVVQQVALGVGQPEQQVVLQLLDLALVALDLRAGRGWVVGRRVEEGERSVGRHRHGGDCSSSSVRAPVRVPQLLAC